MGSGMAAGWPDSVIVGSKIIYRELKSEHGKLSPEQQNYAEVVDIQAWKDAGVAAILRATVDLGSKMLRRLER
jgi:hypothetical protein